MNLIPLFRCLVAELADEGDEASAIRLCHTSDEAASQVLQLCQTFGWDLCELADVVNYGNNTGCRSDAPTLREGFEVSRTKVHVCIA